MGIFRDDSIEGMIALIDYRTTALKDLG